MCCFPGLHIQIPLPPLSLVARGFDWSGALLSAIGEGNVQLCRLDISGGCGLALADVHSFGNR